MMSLITMCLLAFFHCFLMGNSNPLMISACLMITSSVSFMWLYTRTFNSWIPIMLVLLFLGGILVMFMIISSAFPNEHSTKMPKNLYFMCMISFSCSALSNSSSYNFSSSLSLSIFDSMSMVFFLSIMTLYFSLFIFFLEKKFFSMRSCYNILSLVMNY